MDAILHVSGLRDGESLAPKSRFAIADEGAISIGDSLDVVVQSALPENGWLRVTRNGKTREDLKREQRARGGGARKRHSWWRAWRRGALW